MNPSKDEQILRELLEQRILILDGAMGTMIQSHHLDETAFRGPRFATHSHDLAGNNDLLCLTQPELIKNIHRAYYQAGADIIETNSFNSTRSSQADYRLEDITYELNLSGKNSTGSLRRNDSQFSRKTSVRSRRIGAH